MKPFFPYIGSKWLLAPKYGSPWYDTIIEPFCGSAAYSVRHDIKKAVLIDSYRPIIDIWNYLIEATPADIRSLPVEFDRVSSLDLPDGAKYLIGFWISKGTSEPKDIWSSWGRQYRHENNCRVWGEAARERIASQVNSIKEWEAYCTTFDEAPDVEATWFIDPPYQLHGHRIYKNGDINYKECATFCMSRRGQVIVCEGYPVNWLPFERFAHGRGPFGKFRTGRSDEFAFFRDSLTANVVNLLEIMDD